MRLRSVIRKVLKEETVFPLKLKRRIYYVDDEINYLMANVFKPNIICNYYRNSEALVRAVFYGAIERMHITYFREMYNGSDEWNNIYRLLYRYLDSKYSDKIKEYYHINCGD